MATGRDRLSANLAALSYAMGLAELPKGEDALPINVTRGQRPGPVQRARQEQDRAPAGDTYLEYEPGKPLKNFGRRLAWDAGIPLPYNMRQSEEFSEQARIDYENENAYVSAMASTFQSQMLENATEASDDVERRVYEQYAALGADAERAFFADGASGEQRAEALARFTQVGQEARAVMTGDSNERTKFVRQYLAGELSTSRAGIVNLDMAEKDRVLSGEANLARLDNTPRGSTEEQVVLRELLDAAVSRTQSVLSSALGAAGSASSALARHPAAMAASAGLQALGGISKNSDMRLDRDTVVKMALEQDAALDRMTEEFRPELVRLHEGVVSDANRYGIPAASWTASPIKLSTPYADAWTKRLFPEGGSQQPDKPQAGSERQAPTTGTPRNSGELLQQILEPPPMPFEQPRRPTR